MVRCARCLALFVGLGLTLFVGSVATAQQVYTTFIFVAVDYGEIGVCDKPSLATHYKTRAAISSFNPHQGHWLAFFTCDPNATGCSADGNSPSGTIGAWLNSINAHPNYTVECQMHADPASAKAAADLFLAEAESFPGHDYYVPIQECEGDDITGCGDCANDGQDNDNDGDVDEDCEPCNPPAAPECTNLRLIVVPSTETPNDADWVLVGQYTDTGTGQVMRLYAACASQIDETGEVYGVFNGGSEALNWTLTQCGYQSLAGYPDCCSDDPPPPGDCTDGEVEYVRVAVGDPPPGSQWVQIGTWVISFDQFDYVYARCTTTPTSTFNPVGSAEFNRTQPDPVCCDDDPPPPPPPPPNDCSETVWYELGIEGEVIPDGMTHVGWVDDPLADTGRRPVFAMCAEGSDSYNPEDDASFVRIAPNPVCCVIEDCDGNGVPDEEQYPLPDCADCDGDGEYDPHEVNPPDCMDEPGNCCCQCGPITVHVTVEIPQPTQEELDDMSGQGSPPEENPYEIDDDWERIKAKLEPFIPDFEFEQTRQEDIRLELGEYVGTVYIPVAPTPGTWQDEFRLIARAALGWWLAVQFGVGLIEVARVW